MIPCVSILMPVCNAERYVREAVESMLAQTVGDFEFIIINDGSTDHSGDILRDFAERDRRIRLISRENRGIVASLNEGLQLAQGAYLARMDADDISLPERLSTQVHYLAMHPRCVAVGSRVLLIDPAGQVIGPKEDRYGSAADIDRALMQGEWPIVHPSLMARTADLRRVGGYRDWPTWEDHDLFLRMSEVGELANVPQVLLKYRVHLSSIMHQRAKQKESALLQLIRDAYRRRGLPSPSEADLPRCHCQSSLDHQRNWCWWALHAGNVATARKHAWRAFWKAPLDRESWRLLYCAARGR